MDIQLQHHSPTDALLKVTVSATDYQPGLTQRIKKYSQKARLPGFRSGQVPVTHIQRLYGKTLLLEELDELLKKSIQQYFQEHKLQTIGEPLLEHSDELNDPQQAADYHFSYHIGLQPEFSLEKIDRLSFTRYRITLEEKDLSELIENIQYRFGETTHPQKVEGLDVLLCGKLETKTNQSETLTLAISSMLAEAQALFNGLSTGEGLFICPLSLYAKDAVPTIFRRLEKQGLDLGAHYSFLLERIDHVQKAELNEALFQKVYGPEVSLTQEEFIEKNKTYLSEQYERESLRFLYHQIKEKLLHDFAPSLPESYLRKHFAHHIPEEQKKQMNEQTLEEAFLRYQKDLQWRLIQSKTSSTHQLTISAEELHHEAEALLLRQARVYTTPSEQQREEIAPFVQKYLSSAEHREQLYVQMQEGKVLNFLSTQVQTKDQQITITAFHEIPAQLST